jgi:hypothetical protein
VHIFRALQETEGYSKAEVEYSKYKSLQLRKASRKMRKCSQNSQLSYPIQRNTVTREDDQRAPTIPKQI